MRLKIQAILLEDQIESSPSESNCDSEDEDNQQTEYSKLACGIDKNAKEKSLGMLACKFIRLLKAHKFIAIEKAAEILSQNIANKYKTKVV